MDKDKDIKKIIEGIGDNVNPTEEQLGKLKEMIGEYESKSHDEIIIEMIQLNKKMAEEMDEDKYNEMMMKLEEIRPLLNDEQLGKLDSILKTLKENQ